MECLSEADCGDGKVEIRCKKYDVTFERSLITIRHTRESSCNKCRSVKRIIKGNLNNTVTERKAKQFRLKQINKACSLVCKVLNHKKQNELKREREEERRLAGVRNDNNLKQVTLKICPQCGKMFVTTSVVQLYCSSTCERIVHDLKRSNVKVIDKDITLSKLYKRDHGVCQLCGGLCDWNDYKIIDGIKVCGNTYPSKDHIIPVSKGGKESWDNVQLAHRICNSRKGNKINVIVQK